ncbi:AcrR family transcriptional regulator [Mycobacterium frederiksbergense]|uniref:AcrR family transcriptional regulator n=1 Tax=Mycolicibacterium frederiksbergense TaxID=117567 RepID=A0ABT6L129_9MYCO|nr:TetR/AcrR family transcriptional regulator [Mycolicibacterium frederiksbergense]MDH6195985.1 AcrR family transcriptional regulator [Mycolicibacterium frederiksbergense]
MARPSNQKKRRAEIVAAATIAVHKHGAAGINLKRIAEAADMSSALLLYYYSDVNDILAAVYRSAAKQFLDEREQLVAKETLPLSMLSRCIELGTPYPGKRCEAARILYELAPVIVEEPTAASWSRRFFSGQAELYLRIVEAGIASGDFSPLLPPAKIATAMVALEDGLAIHAMTGLLTPEDVEADLLAHAEALLCIASPKWADRAGEGSEIPTVSA